MMIMGKARMIKKVMMMITEMNMARRMKVKLKLKIKKEKSPKINWKVDSKRTLKI